jgi:hypothetical protein
MRRKGKKALYEHARDMWEEYLGGKFKNLPSQRRKEKQDIHLGYLLQHHFGNSVWTLKNLDDTQLLQIMGIWHEKMEKRTGGQKSTPFENCADGYSTRSCIVQD